MANVFQFRARDRVVFTVDGIRQEGVVLEALRGTLLVLLSSDDSPTLVISTTDVELVYRKRAKYRLNHGVIED
jgi:hypothetical protein